MTIDPFNGMQMIRAGKLRPLAVLASKRSPALPDVPTMQEAGIPGMSFNSGPACWRRPARPGRSSCG